MPLRPALSFNLILAAIGLSVAAETALLWKLSQHPPAPPAQIAPRPVSVAKVPVFTLPGVEPPADSPDASSPANPNFPALASTRGNTKGAPKTNPFPANLPAPTAPISSADRDEAKALFQAATAALARKDNQSALEGFRKVVAIAPNHLPTRLNLALIYLGANRPAQALVHLEKAVQLDPKNPATRFELGRTFLRLKRPDAALAPLQEAVRLAPREPQARALLAEVYGALKRPRDALAQWSAAAKSDPRDVVAHLQAAQLTASLGRPKDAEKWLRLAISGAPRDPQAPLVLSRVLMSQNKAKDAAAVLSKAVKARPDVFELWPPLADARLASRDLGGARDAIQSALLRLPKGDTEAQKTQISQVEGTLQLTLGRILGQQKQPRQAKTAFARAAQLLPRAAEPKSLLALALLQSGDRKGATAALQSALALDEKRAGDRLTLAQIFAQDKNYNASRIQYARYAQLQPRDAGALLEWAQVAGLAKKPDEELQIWDKLAALQPKNPAPLLQRGVLLRSLHRPTDALGSFERALRLNPRDANVLFEIARLQSESNQPKSAAQTWKDIIALRPDYIPAYTAFLQNSQRSGDETGARLFLARQLSTGRENPRLLSEILHFYSQNKRNSQAQALLSDLVQRNPNARSAQAALRSFDAPTPPQPTPSSAPTPVTTPATTREDGVRGIN